RPIGRPIARACWRAACPSCRSSSSDDADRRRLRSRASAVKPSQEFGLWARRAPTGERAAAAVATIIALALLIWLLAPGPGEKTTGVAAGTSGSGLSGAAPAATDGAGSGSAVTGASAGGG